MAFTMKHWIGLTLTGLAFVAIWQLPPDVMPARSPSLQSAEEMRHDGIEREVIENAEILRRVLWADSLTELAFATAENGIAIVAPAASETVASQVENQKGRLADKVRDEIDAIDENRPDVLFAYVLQLHDQGDVPDRGSSARDRTETFVGSRDGQDYCMQVRVAASGYHEGVIVRELLDFDNVTPRAGTLGACHFYVGYGLPGARIQEWMERGGVTFGLEAGPRAISSTRTDLGRPGRRSFLGFSAMASSSRPIEADQCLAGMADACAYLFGNPAITNPVLLRQLDIVLASPATSIGPQPFPSFVQNEEFLLADLEAEFGPEAFRGFWTSTEDVDTAFEEAFGTDSGSWLLSWLEPTVGVDEPGPGLPRSASGGSMLALMAFLGIAFWRNRERRVT